MRQAIAAPTIAAANRAWAHANRRITEDAAIVPLFAGKTPVFHSENVRGCVWWWPSGNCDLTNVWLKS